MKTKWNWMIVIVLAAALLLPVTTASAAATYADAVVSTSGTVLNSGNALGAPDKAYTTLASASAWIELHMVAPLQGTLTVYHTSTPMSCIVGTFSADGTVPYIFGYTTPNLSTSTFTVPTGVNLSQDIGVQCNTASKKTPFKLDAVSLGQESVYPAYAVSVSATSGTVLNSGNALGAPDKAYTTLASASAWIQLQMAAPLQGTLTVYHSNTSISCIVGTFSADGTVPYIFGYTTAGATTSTFTVPTGVNLSQDIGVQCNTASKKTPFKLDAVMVTP